MKIRFSIKPFLLFLFFLFIEIYIGIFVRDKFIRPFGGDFLVIFLLYYFIKSFIDYKTHILVIGVLLFAYLVEGLQYLNFADFFQIKNKVLRIILGTSFSWEDILAYTMGAVCCYILEIFFNKKKDGRA